MKLPVRAVAATDRLEVVPITAGPERLGDPLTGDVVAQGQPAAGHPGGAAGPYGMAP